MSSEFITIRLAGHLGIERYPELLEAFRSPREPEPVLVDLREGTGADSLFLSELLLFKRRHAAPIAVVIPTEGNLARIFALAGMGTKMDVYTTLDEAWQALGAQRR